MRARKLRGEAEKKFLGACGLFWGAEIWGRPPLGKKRKKQNSIIVVHKLGPNLISKFRHLLAMSEWYQAQLGKYLN